MKLYRNAIILALVLAALAGVAYWDNEQTKKDQAAEKEKNKLVQFLEPDVEGLRYEEGNLNLHFVKKDGQWFMDTPLSEKTEAGSVDGLIRTIIDYKYEKEITSDKARLTEFGLEKPQRTITFEIKDKEPLRIDLGEKSTVGFSIYLKTSKSDAIYLGAQHILSATSKKLEDFRNKTLLSLDTAKLSTVEIDRRASKRIILKKDKGDFVFVEPAGLSNTDPTAVSDFLSSLAADKIESFIDKPTAKQQALFLPAKRFATLRWQDESGAKGELAFAEGDKGEMFASLNPATLIYKVPSSIKAKLEKKPFDFQDRRIAKFVSADVVKVEIDGTKYEKKDNSWYPEGTDPAKKDESGKTAEAKYFVQSLVVDLEYTKASEIADKAVTAKVTASAPKHKVVLGFVDEKKATPLSFSAWEDKSKENSYLVKVSGRDEAFWVAKSAFSNVSEKATAEANTPASLGEEPPPELQH